MSKSDINITILPRDLRVSEKQFRRVADAMRQFGLVADRVWRDLYPDMIDEADAKILAVVTHKRGR